MTLAEAEAKRTMNTRGIQQLGLSAESKRIRTRERYRGVLFQSWKICLAGARQRTERSRGRNRHKGNQEEPPACLPPLLPLPFPAPPFLTRGGPPKMARA